MSYQGDTITIAEAVERLIAAGFADARKSYNFPGVAFTGRDGKLWSLPTDYRARIKLRFVDVAVERA